MTVGIKDYEHELNIRFLTFVHTRIEYSCCCLLASLTATLNAHVQRLYNGNAYTTILIRRFDNLLTPFHPYQQLNV